MTLRIVDYLNLRSDDIFILNSRKIKGIPTYLRSIELPYAFDYFPYFTLRKIYTLKWINTYRIVKNWDCIIENKINSPFIFYAQNGRHYKYRVISSHVNCRGINYFEDGIDFYMTLNEFSRKYSSPLRKVYKLVNYILGTALGVYDRVKQDSFVFPDPYGNSVLYVLSENSARHLSAIIPSKRALNQTSNRNHTQLPKNSTLICFSALEEQGIASNEDMIRGYLDFFSAMKFDSNRDLFLRFHPAQNNFSRAYIVSVFKQFKITVLSDELIIEQYLASQSSDFDLVSCGSSVLNYALELNENVKCYAIYKAIERYAGKTKRSSQWRDTFNENKKNLIIWQ